jgi:tripeptide aminopeptidase
MTDSTVENEKKLYPQTIARIHSEIDWLWLPTLVQSIVDQAIAIQQIAAPTFDEGARASYVETQFKNLGLKSVSTDEMSNVFGLLPGENADPGLMISAHTDTVFPKDTDLTIRREGNLIYGPGLGDNSMGVSAMMGLIEAMKRAQIKPPCDLWFAATSREEGLGDLGGMRAAYTHLKPHIKAVINLEGAVLGHVYHVGIAVKRLKIRATADGGHSWGHFGRASALHGIVDLGARITAIEPPSDPRTTYNIGMIHGGQSINSIAACADMWLDMRSEAQDALNDLETEVRDHIAAVAQDDLHFEIEVVGNRPAGAISADHPLVQTALAAMAQVGVPGVLRNGSTDCNVPLADGCPAVTVGITHGGNTHRLDEFIETSPVATGIKQMLLLVLAAGQLQF